MILPLQRFSPHVGQWAQENIVIHVCSAVWSLIASGLAKGRHTNASSLQCVALIGAFFFQKMAVSVALNGAGSSPCCIKWCLHAFSTKSREKTCFLE